MSGLRDFFASPVMMDALAPALLIAVVTASASVMVMAHRLSYLTVGVSHASLAGLGLAILGGLPLLPAASAFGLLVALMLALMPERRGISEDAGTGMLFAGSMALGVVLIAQAPRAQVDLYGLLFGNILTVTPDERLWLVAAGGGCMIVLALAARAWWMIALDATAAEAGGLPVRPLRLALFGLVGVTVMLCVKLAGIVLTTGLMVLPAASAWFWGRSLAGLWLGAVGVSIVGTLVGLLVSYAYDWPSGASVVLALCAIFVLSWGISWLIRIVRRR